MPHCVRVLLALGDLVDDSEGERDARDVEDGERLHDREDRVDALGKRLASAAALADGEPE